MEHGPAPHNRLIAGDKHAYRDDLHVMGHRRHDHVVDLRGRRRHPEHPGDREAVHVSVHDTDPQAVSRHRGREVDGDRGLADAALAGGHGIHPREGAGLGKRDFALRDPAAELGFERGALLVAHDIEDDVDRGDPVDSHERRGGVAAERVFEWAASDGEPDFEGRVSGVVDGDRLDHAEFGDRLADLGVVDLREGSEEGISGGC